MPTLGSGETSAGRVQRRVGMCFVCVCVCMCECVSCVCVYVCVCVSDIECVIDVCVCDKLRASSLTARVDELQRVGFALVAKDGPEEKRGEKGSG